MNHRRRRARSDRNLPRRRAIEAMFQEQLAGRVQQRAAHVAVGIHRGTPATAHSCAAAARQV
jgi:hypothetical protein